MSKLKYPVRKGVKYLTVLHNKLLHRELRAPVRVRRLKKINT